MTTVELPFTTITVETVKKKWTQAEFHDLPEGPPYFELEDGDLIEMAQSTLRHQEVSGNLNTAVLIYLRQNKLGKIWQEVEVDITPTRTYVPDLVFLAKERFALIEEGKRVVGPPDLVVEILSPATASKDQTVKLKAYQQAGVPWYWIVDPEELVILEHKNTAEGYLLSQIVIPPDSFSPGVFAGLTFNLAELMGELSVKEDQNNE